MSSIDFFVPVFYSNQIKTIPQQALETIDEYFYLGGKFRITIFDPNAEHPQSWAMQNHQNRHRSWINVTLKVVSYCTIILPLVALLIKATLRCYLQVSSIRVQQGSVPSSCMEVRLLNEALQYIGSFLSYQDQAQLAQAAIFTRDAARDTQQYYIDLMAPLKTEIEALPVGPIARGDFQRLLGGLVTSPAAIHPKHWIPVMDALMRRLGSDDTVNGIVQKHSNIANLLATSEQPISSDQIYEFCRYLGRKQLSKIMPWIGYRALEQYSLKPQLNSVSVNKAIKEYLTQQAKKHIQARSNGYFLPNNRMLSFQETNIDPRKWFGFNREENSLWTQPGAQNGEIALMPELLLEVLWTHIQSLRASCIDRPFMVYMTGRAEAELPHNFTLTIAQRITNADIFLDHNHTINTEEIEKRKYARCLGNLSDEEMEALAAEHYPNAVAIRN
jgi:hypothetical protein